MKGFRCESFGGSHITTLQFETPRSYILRGGDDSEAEFAEHLHTS